jgi:formaldehyde-activating enzyme
LAAGADGAILASANLIPDIWQEIYRYVKEGRLEEAQERQRAIQILIRIVATCGPTQAVKEGLGMMGVMVGDSRYPMMSAGAFKRDDADDLRWQLESAGKIPTREIEYILGSKVVRSAVPATPQTPQKVEGFTLRVGEAYFGPPEYEAAHIDLLLGLAHGPVGKALDEALSRPLEVAPSPLTRSVVITERPRTLLVPTVTVRTKRQEEQLYIYAKEGLLVAIEASIKDGFLPSEALDELVMIANVFVHPSAANHRRIQVNNYKAMRAAIRRAIEGRPTLAEMFHEKEAARHPLRYAP